MSSYYIICKFDTDISKDIKMLNFVSLNIGSLDQNISPLFEGTGGKRQ